MGLHGLLAVILLVSNGFSSAPPSPADLQILNMIPANILDRDGAGGGTPAVNIVAHQAQAQPRPQQQPQPTPQPQPVQRAEPERPQRPTLHERQEITRPQPKLEETDEVSLEPKAKPTRRPSHKHEIEVSYTPANTSKKNKRPVDTSESSESSARSEARRLKAIENSLDQLASGVRSSGSPNNIVDVSGIGGGEAYAGYRDVVFTYYNRAWNTPDDAASRLLYADAKVTIARDGSVISADLIRPSGDTALDRSIERALRAVNKLPPFPASSHDAERTFVLRFNVEAKQMSG